MKRLMSQDLDTETVQIAHDDGEGGLYLETKQNIDAFSRAEQKLLRSYRRTSQMGRVHTYCEYSLYCYTTVKQGGDTEGVSHSRA
jgi:hypothetical protein